MKNQLIHTVRTHAFQRNLRVMLFFVLPVLGLALAGCQKWVDVGAPKDAIASDLVFTDEPGLQAAIAGLYSSGNGRGTISPVAAYSLLTGLLADDLTYNGNTFDQYKNNGLVSNDGMVSALWVNPYSIIYRANAIIDGVANGNFSDAVKKQATGEALFMRALQHFYLVNLYGDVPLITTTVVQENQLAPRAASSNVYAQIKADLEQAASVLPEVYASGSKRYRANKWAATALLARVYLYTGEYARAEAAATQVLNASTLYRLPSDLTTVFLNTSMEAIFGFDVASLGYTDVGALAVPAMGNPNYIIHPSLLTSFEANDKRRATWIATASGYAYPYKYRVRTGAGAEFDVVLRLAEQYLIRAEARAMAQPGNLSGAQDDVNAVRARAGLGAVTLSTPAAARVAIAQERRTEFFAEWGHRWLDLKRTNQANAVIGTLKPGLWQSTDTLLPIPSVEREKNVHLTQNPGYN